MTRDEIIEKLMKYKAEHKECFGIINLGVFGSVARYQNNEESDIDIFIETKVPNPFIIIEIKEELEKMFHKKVDIVRKREKMNSYLKARIQSEGIYV